MMETEKVEIRGEQYDLAVLRRMIERTEGHAIGLRDSADQLDKQASKLRKEARIDDKQAASYKKMLAMYEAAK